MKNSNSETSNTSYSLEQALEREKPFICSVVDEVREQIKHCRTNEVPYYKFSVFNLYTSELAPFASDSRFAIFKFDFTVNTLNLRIYKYSGSVRFVSSSLQNQLNNHPHTLGYMGIIDITKLFEMIKYLVPDLSPTKTVSEFSDHTNSWKSFLFNFRF